MKTLKNLGRDRHGNFIAPITSEIRRCANSFTGPEDERQILMMHKERTHNEKQDRSKYMRGSSDKLLYKTERFKNAV